MGNGTKEHPDDRNLIKAVLDLKVKGDSRAMKKVLVAHGFNNLTRATKNIQNLAEDDLALDSFVRFIPLLFKSIDHFGDPDMALNNWERFLRVAFDRNALFHLLSENVNVIRFFNRIFSFSQFISDNLVRNPEYFDWLIQQNFLTAELTPENLMEEFKRSMNIFRDSVKRRNALCRMRRRGLLRIGVKDLLDMASIEDITRELSDLAEVILKLALEEEMGKHIQTYGEPLIADEEKGSRQCGFVVVAMGKLGARELNFSSDLDLVFVYEDEGETSGISPENRQVKKISNHEFFSRLARSIVTFLSDYTEEGRLYRCDIRLRPEGDSGPLARSIESYANYFFSQARFWECIAYLKARSVAGDTDVGNAFRRLVEEFIFASKDPVTFKSEIIHLKERIDFEVQEKELSTRDIKRGFGGIREIEFIVSTLQILHAHRFPNLNTVSTFEGIRELEKAGLLNHEEASCLLDGYSFLRKVEHRLQIVWEIQTHLLPESEEELEKLAIRAGFSGKGATHQFLSMLESTRHSVHRMFINIVHPHPDKKSPDEASETLHLLDRDIPEEKRFEILEAYRFSDPVSIKHLDTLHHGTREVYSSATTQKHFEQLLPIILRVCKRVPRPDAALRNILNFTSASKAAAYFYDFGLQQPAVLEGLLHLFGTSDAMSQVLISHPEYFEPLVISFEEFSKHGLRPVEEGFADFIPESSHPSSLADIRRFKNFWCLLTSLYDLVCSTNPQEISCSLTDLAEFVLKKVSSAISTELHDKYGTPINEKTGEAATFFLFAFGGFGGYEINYFSDLDLVAVMEGEGTTNGTTKIENKVFFSRIVETIGSEMENVTPDGTLYKIDMRLRPEGSSGELVCTTDCFLRYYKHEAHLWELQSFLKARLVGGNTTRAEQLHREISRIIQERMQKVPCEELQRHIVEMRGRLEESVQSLPPRAAADFKRGYGGLVGIEFTVQYLQLKHCVDHSDIFTTSTIDAIKRLTALGLLSREDSTVLKENYYFLRLIESRQRLLHGKSVDFFPADQDLIQRLAFAMSPVISSSGELQKRFHSTLKRNREIFSRILGI